MENSVTKLGFTKFKDIKLDENFHQNLENLVLIKTVFYDFRHLSAAAIIFMKASWIEQSSCQWLYSSFSQSRVHDITITPGRPPTHISLFSQSLYPSLSLYYNIHLTIMEIRYIYVMHITHAVRARSVTVPSDLSNRFLHHGARKSEGSLHKSSSPANDYLRKS